MALSPDRFEGRVAVITGGASGLGLAAATHIAAGGGKVVLWDADAGKLASARQAAGAADAAVVDVTNPGAVLRAMANVHHLSGRIDILIASAGITGATAPVASMTAENWLRVMDVNLNGTFYCCKAAIPFMEANKYGRIVNIASVAGKEGNPNASAYSASKAGVIGLTKSLGKELAASGILVNCITPATFESPILQQLPQSQIDYMRSRIPMGRLGRVEEVAALTCWLASEDCSFSTAATFDISGGRTTY